MIRFATLMIASLAMPVALMAAPDIKLLPTYEKIEVERPVSIQIPNDGSDRLFLVEQTGKIKILPSRLESEESVLFLDLTDSIGVEKDFEEGLLGLAFHPKYKETGKFYLTFSRQGPKRLVVAEYSVSNEANTADPVSERVLLEVQQPEWNHNSGNLMFGPDGFLYICIGDGGLKNGVHLLSQKLTRWNGKVLRIDVDSRSDGLEYGIPEGNPFVDDSLACPEIWAYGLRNPWGGAFDPETGLFYLADVGQNLWEEINIIEGGGNYGWDYREGAQRFATRDAFMEWLGKKPTEPKGLELIDPIHGYSRADGLSITGGFVYRGDGIPDLDGHFIYGDWKFGNIWALNYDAEKKEVTANYHLDKPEDLKNPTVQPTGFYPDADGEPLVLDWRGAIFRIVATN
ncbi:MAG: glucose sorbosone dehydrogenase [Verrucomicrobiales bacterium]|nr:glucose sorbosone dehydrogenase [Verrucomicrobiales bacterium]